MACPYTQSMMNTINDNNNDGVIEDQQSASTTTISHDDTDLLVKNKKKEEEEEEPLNYTTYLRTEPLLSALKCLSHIDPSDENSEPVHSEHIFILLHQVYELWFKGVLFELDSIRKIFITNNDSNNIMESLFNINSRLTRCVKIWDILIEQLELLETMTPIEFLEFRNYITPASGFQSLQFRMIEMKLGLTDKSRRSYKKDYFTHTMFKNEQAEQLEKTSSELSLLVLLESWLGKVYDSMEFDFLDEFKLALSRFIEYEKQQKLQNGADVTTIEEASQTTYRQFEQMIDKNEYDKLSEQNERRISHKAMLAVLMITLYHQNPCFQQIYQMLYLLMDFDVAVANWRYRHILLVQRQIGRKTGSGGTGGFSYLSQTVNDKYLVFADFFNVSSYLIPQRFLSPLSDKISTSKTIQATQSLSSLRLQPCRELPASNRSISPKSKQNISAIILNQSNNYLFYCLSIIILMLAIIIYRLFLW